MLHRPSGNAWKLALQWQRGLRSKTGKQPVVPVLPQSSRVASQAVRCRAHSLPPLYINRCIQNLASPYPSDVSEEQPYMRKGASIGAEMLDAARAIAREHQAVCDITRAERLAKIREREKSFLTEAARKGMDLPNTELKKLDWYDAWGEVIESILRSDDGHYIYEPWYAGIDDGQLKTERPFLMVSKQPHRGQGSIVLIVFGHPGLSMESFHDMKAAIEEVSRFLQQEGYTRNDTIPFLVFRGPRFCWGITRNGQLPLFQCDPLDARGRDAERSLEILARYISMM